MDLSTPRFRLQLAALLLASLAAVFILSALETGLQAPLSERLRDAVDEQQVLGGLSELEAIADTHDGIRAAGTEGQLASANYVAEQLSAAGYAVRVDTFDLPLFSEVGENTVEVGDRTYTSGVDFRPMIFSASADLTALVVPVGFDPAATTETVVGAGCDEGDFAEVPADALLLVQPGGCAARDVVDSAMAAGASGLIISYPSWVTNAVRRPTLRMPDVTIPVLGTTGEMGIELNAAAAEGTTVTLNIETSIETRPSANVFAETPTGDDTHVIVVGGHLDSVIDGPGVNDNGSGTMAILEIARRMLKMETARKVRFAFWTGEEIGLWGSFRYVNALRTDERQAIDAYLNFDMLGSPNGARIVYDDADAAFGSDLIRDAFISYFDDAGLATVTEDLGGASDHLPFQLWNIPTGGLFSGASAEKTAEEAELFGGEAGDPLDACYHFACDRADNVDPELLGQMLRAAAYVTGQLASGEVIVRE